MARVLSSQIGDIRGRIGNQVFSRNKHGNYVRSWVNPAQPNNVPQSRARNAFGTAITGYRTLSSLQKTKWQEFADNHFIPKRRNYTKAYSGFDAYVSLNTAAQMGLVQNVDYEIRIDGNTQPGNTVKLSFDPTVANPPTKSFVNFSTEEGSPPNNILPWLLIDAKVGQDATFQFNLQLDSGIDAAGNGQNIVNNRDRYGTPIGYALYMSNGNPSDNMSYKRPMQYCLGYMNPWQLQPDTNPFNDFGEVQINSVTTIVPGEYDSFPLENEFVRLTLYFISQRGQLIKVGSLEREVQGSIVV